MALTPKQWREVVGTAQNKLESSLPLITAYEIRKVAPVGVDDRNQNYWTDMTQAQRQALIADFIAIIDGVISDLQSARNA